MPRVTLSFQGLIAFVPNTGLAAGPIEVDALIRNLRTGKRIDEIYGPAGDRRTYFIDSHLAWLQYDPDDLESDSGAGFRVSTVTSTAAGRFTQVLPLQRDVVTLRLDGQEIAPAPMVVRPRLLRTLPVYHGQVRDQLRFRENLPRQVAAYVRLRGGALQATATTQGQYHVPRHDGTTGRIGAATEVAWSRSYNDRVEVRVRGHDRIPATGNRVRVLRFRPSPLEVIVCNREAEDLLLPPGAPRGGRDDHDYLVYGQSIRNGTPRILEAVPGGPIPNGRRACGSGAIQL